MFNIIGDIHGRTNWKELVRDDCTNIFIGDYFDPYDNIKFGDLVSNFMDIILFKSKHPETILLLGNHDYLTYYIPTEHYSRYNYNNANDIKLLLHENVDYLNGFAYLIDNQYVVTHAGITYDWTNKWLSRDVVSNENPKEIVDNINSLFGEVTPFTFSDNCSYFDVYGDSATQSPLWIRPQSLIEHNLFKDTNIKQVVGHTQVSQIVKGNNVILVDCLGTVTNSLVINNSKEFIQDSNKELVELKNYDERI